MLFASPVHGQDGQAVELSPSSLAGEVAAVQAENAALREQLRRLEEQQKTLLELVHGLQQRFEGSSATLTSVAVPLKLPDANAAAQMVPPSAANGAAQAVPLMDRLTDRYNDGFVLVDTEDASKFPFYLKLNNTSQFRYINLQPVSDTFTDHLGVVKPVASRNDFGINRSMFTFGGFVFDKRLKFSLVTWTSNTLAAIVVGGNVSWEFNKGLTLYAGYWTVPGTRTLTYTFPYFTQIDRSLADNFFRPGFTQGIWTTGEPLKGFFHQIFVGNGLNTLTIPTGKIDTNLMFAGSVWWEPLGPYGPPGKARNMYDDYYTSDSPVARVGTSYTRSREDRFSNLDERNPENTSLHNSDGVLTFSTGAFALDVTLQEATYRMWAMDGGMKWRGLAVNGQYYFRWLDSFVADGPLPLSSTFDDGGELEVSQFVVPEKWMLYGRTSAVFGQFGNSWEYAGGFKWFFVGDHRVWISGEALRIHKSAFGGFIYPYVGGMTGWAPMAQLIFQF